MDNPNTHRPGVLYETLFLVRHNPSVLTRVKITMYDR